MTEASDNHTPDTQAPATELKVVDGGSNPTDPVQNQFRQMLGNMMSQRNAPLSREKIFWDSGLNKPSWYMTVIGPDLSRDGQFQISDRPFSVSISIDEMREAVQLSEEEGSTIVLGDKRLLRESDGKVKLIFVKTGSRSGSGDFMEGGVRKKAIVFTREGWERYKGWADPYLDETVVAPEF
jgi:hypothetical protein